MVERICKWCDRKFLVQSYRLKRGEGKFCSLHCRHSAQETGADVRCAWCATLVYKKRSEILASKTKTFFCKIRNHQILWFNYRDKQCSLCGAHGKRLFKSFKYDIIVRIPGTTKKKHLYICKNCEDWFEDDSYREKIIHELSFAAD